jgi:hypothetical protein
MYKLSFNTTGCIFLVLNVAHTGICGLGGALRIYLHDLHQYFNRVSSCFAGIMINFFSGLILSLINKASNV